MKKLFKCIPDLFWWQGPVLAVRQTRAAGLDAMNRGGEVNLLLGKGIALPPSSSYLPTAFLRISSSNSSEAVGGPM
jgi:hypothetical protein